MSELLLCDPSCLILNVLSSCCTHCLLSLHVFFIYVFLSMLTQSGPARIKRKFKQLDSNVAFEILLSCLFPTLIKQICSNLLIKSLKLNQH